MSRFNILIIIMFIFSSVSIVIITRRNDHQRELRVNADLQSLTLELTGKIIEKTPVTNNCGVLVLEVLDSNEDSYRFPAKEIQQEYYVQIKKKRAYLIECRLSQMQKGDSVVINGSKGVTRFYQ